MRSLAYVGALLVLLVPHAGNGQQVVIEADLFAGSTQLAHCVSDDSATHACRLVPSMQLGAGVVRVETRDSSGDARVLRVAIRGIESAIEVRRESGGDVEVARITPAPPTLSVTVMPSGEGEALLFVLFNATQATVHPHPDRGISLVRVQRIRPDSSAVDLRWQGTCGNWVIDAARTRMRVAPGAALISYGAAPTGSHGLLQSGSSYRVEVCVGVESGVWWEEGTDPLALFDASSDVAVTDVLCDTRTYTAEQLRAAAAAPAVGDLPGRVTWAH